MSRVFVDTADTGGDLDLVALDTDGFDSVFKKSPSVPCAWKPTRSTVQLLFHSHRLR